MLRRTNQHLFMLDDAESAMLAHAVQKTGLSKSAYFRLVAVYGKEPREKPPPEYYEILKEIRGACRNLNQLTMVANATGSIHIDSLIEMRDILLSELLKTRAAVELPRKET